MLTFEEVKSNEKIKTFIKKSDETLSALGFTEHSFAHVMRVSDIAGNILQELGYSAAEINAALKGVEPTASTEEMVRYALRAMVIKG